MPNQKSDVANIKISLITPVLNEETYIEQTILSVLNQNYPNLEYIIIDGGSTDRTVEIIKQYEHKLTYWISEPDTGPASALNKGFEISTGDVMGWINANDVILPGGLHLASEIFYKYEFIEWVNGQHTLIDEKGRIVHVKLPVKTAVYSFMFGSAFPSIQQESTFWRRNLWNKSGGYLSDNISLAFDFELWIRFFRHAPLFYTYGLIGAFRHHEGQLSSQIDKYKQQGKMALEVERKHYRFPPYNDVLDGDSPPVLRYSPQEKDIVFSKTIDFDKLPESSPTHLLTRHYVEASDRSFWGIVKRHTYSHSSGNQVDTLYHVQDNERIDWVGYHILDAFDRLFERQWYDSEMKRSKEFIEQLSLERNFDQCVIVEDSNDTDISLIKQIVATDVILANYPVFNPELVSMADFFTSSDLLEIQKYSSVISQHVQVTQFFPFWFSHIINSQKNVYFLVAVYLQQFSDNVTKWISWMGSPTFFALQIAYTLGYKKVLLFPARPENRGFLKTLSFKDEEIAEHAHSLAITAFANDGRTIIDGRFGGNLQALDSEL